MSKFKYMNNEQYFLILRYLETTTNKCDQISFEKNGDYVMYLGQAMGICPGLMNFQTFDTSGTPYYTTFTKVGTH